MDRTDNVGTLPQASKSLSARSRPDNDLLGRRASINRHHSEADVTGPWRGPDSERQREQGRIIEHPKPLKDLRASAPDPTDREVRRLLMRRNTTEFDSRKADALVVDPQVVSSDKIRSALKGSTTSLADEDEFDGVQPPPTNLPCAAHGVSACFICPGVDPTSPRIKNQPCTAHGADVCFICPGLHADLASPPSLTEKLEKPEKKKGSSKKRSWIRRAEADQAVLITLPDHQLANPLDILPVRRVSPTLEASISSLMVADTKKERPVLDEDDSCSASASEFPDPPSMWVLFSSGWSCRIVVEAYSGA